MLTIFSRLAAGEEMPVREKIRVRRGRPAAHRPRRARRTRAGAQPARNRAACARGWAGSRPCWCWGRSSPPHCSPPRWPSTPAATRPAPGRWERRARRPPSRSMPARAEADAPRAEMTGAAAQLARPVEPRVRQERAGFRAAALPAGPAGGAGLSARTEWPVSGSRGTACGRRPARSRWGWLRGGPGSAAPSCSPCCWSSSGAVPGGLNWPRQAGRFPGCALAVLRHVGSRLRAGLLPGLVGRWGPADMPCGICGLPGLWPLGRCRAGRVIPSVGGVPELPALPIEGTRDDRGREPQ